jgi:hypothetical protein
VADVISDLVPWAVAVAIPLVPVLFLIHLTRVLRQIGRSEPGAGGSTKARMRPSGRDLRALGRRPDGGSAARQRPWGKAKRRLVVTTATTCSVDGGIVAGPIETQFRRQAPAWAVRALGHQTTGERPLADAA